MNSVVGKGERPSRRIDTSVPHPARRYNYFLGGKDNFAADRASGDAMSAIFPSIREAALENRRFLKRVTTFLAAEAGIRQFLDIGTGIPGPDNTHEVAQGIAPTSRIVYVDNDPIVLSHARALLTSSPEGRTAYIDADLREPAQIMADPELRSTLDLNQPVAVLLIAVMHFVPWSTDPRQIIDTLLADLPTGSYLAMSHGTLDLLTPELRAQIEAVIDSGQHDTWPRSVAQIERLFDGLEVVPPGVVSITDWRADAEPAPRPSPTDISIYGGVARVPTGR